MIYLFCLKLDNHFYSNSAFSSTGQPATFNVTVKPASNFPVDIYLLLDATFSMEDDVLNIKRLGGVIGTLVYLSKLIKSSARQKFLTFQKVNIL